MIRLTFYFLAPSQPRNVKVLAVKTHDSLFLRWSKPANTYGDLLSYKIILLKKSKKVRTEVVHPSLNSFKIERLSANTKYIIKILATNQQGDGEPASVIAGKQNFVSEICKQQKVIIDNRQL